jgi:hypothetical protein
MGLDELDSQFEFGWSEGVQRVWSFSFPRSGSQEGQLCQIESHVVVISDRYDCVGDG